MSLSAVAARSTDTVDPDMIFSDVQTVQLPVNPPKAAGVSTAPELAGRASGVNNTIGPHTGSLGRYEDLGLLGVGGMGECVGFEMNLRRIMATDHSHVLYGATEVSEPICGRGTNSSPATAPQHRAHLRN